MREAHEKTTFKTDPSALPVIRCQFLKLELPVGVWRTLFSTPYSKIYCEMVENCSENVTFMAWSAIAAGAARSNSINDWSD